MNNKTINKEKAKDYFNSLEQFNFAKLTNLIDESIICHQPGNNQFSGIKKG